MLHEPGTESDNIVSQKAEYTKRFLFYSFRDTKNILNSLFGEVRIAGGGCQCQWQDICFIGVIKCQDSSDQMTLGPWL